MNPRDIKPVIDEPLNRLFFAINHYVSTGDHFGEGVAYPIGGEVQIVIPVAKGSEQDQRDFAAFRARWEEIEGAPPIGWMGEHGEFEAWTVLVAEADMDRLAQELRSRPGSLGWGSGKAVIDAHRWEDPR